MCSSDLHYFVCFVVSCTFEIKSQQIKFASSSKELVHQPSLTADLKHQNHPENQKIMDEGRDGGLLAKVATCVHCGEIFGLTEMDELKLVKCPHCGST